MKLLEEEEYTRFVEEFEKVPSAVTEGKLLHEQMRLKRRDVRIAVAWRHYSGARLREKGFGDTWQQKYLELLCRQLLAISPRRAIPAIFA